MLWLFDSAIKRGVKKGVDDFLESDRFKQMIEKVWREELAKPENAWFLFVKRIQNCLSRADPGLTDKQAFNLAAGVYRRYLREEKIQYGDPRFDWSADGARNLAQAYKIDHIGSEPHDQ